MRKKKERKEETYESVKDAVHSGRMTSRQFIFKMNAKSKVEFLKEMIRETSFLDRYETETRKITVNERCFYVINDLHNACVCPYCGKLKSFTDRTDKGYNNTCGSRECMSKAKSKELVRSNQKTKENDLKKFHQWESTLTEDNINDEGIIKHFFKGKRGLIRPLVNNITSAALRKWLENRYKDSDSTVETIQRIKLGIEEKPKCATCGKPVKFNVEKPNDEFDKYCSDACAARNLEVIAKKQATDRKHHGGQTGWVLSNKDPKKIAKRRNTLIEKYHTTTLCDVPGIAEKIKKTNIKRFGALNAMQNKDIQKKYMKSMIHSLTPGTSKQEKKMFLFLKKYYPNIIHFYTSKVYPFNCDFYIPEKDLYIEYEGSQYHHYHAFDPANKEDIKEKKRLEEKSEESIMKELCPKNQYQVMLKIWTVADPEKRMVAKKNKLNFLELWNLKNLDDDIRKINEFPDIHKD